MAEKELILKEKVDHSGIFDFPAFYAYAHAWLKEHGYAISEGKYAENVSGNERDIAIEWKATKDFSDYFRAEVIVKTVVKGMSEVDVEIEGVEKKMNKGQVGVELTGNLIKDPTSKWESSTFQRFWRDVYNKYIIPSRIEEMGDKVNGDVVNLKEEMKAFLELSGKR